MHRKMEAELVTETVKIGSDNCQKQQSGKVFPLILEPARPGVNFVELQEYFQKKHETVIKAASEYGAVLFKGFDLANGEEWASVLYESGLKEMEYVGGAAVRKLIVGNSERMTNPQIVTTNESPPSEPIPFHHELAQTPNPPDHISFFCLINDAEGGATPLIRSDMIYDWLLQTYPEFTKKIEELGVKYIRVAPEEDDASSALGRSWKSMFNVKTREQAEAEMTKAGATWEWLPGGDCKVLPPSYPGRLVHLLSPSRCRQSLSEALLTSPRHGGAHGGVTLHGSSPQVISKTLPAVRVASNGRKSFFNQVGPDPANPPTRRAPLPAAGSVRRAARAAPAGYPPGRIFRVTAAHCRGSGGK